MTRSLRQGLIWGAFALLFVLATAPAWRVIASGVSPTLDQTLLSICSGERRP